MSQYEPIDAVESGEDGRAVRLKLQRRLDVPPSPFFTVSWRTEYPGTAKNRRFYWVADECWTVRASTAVDMLDRATGKGLLDERYDDQYVRFGGGVPSFTDSRSLSRAQAEEVWSEITREGFEPAWGKSPVFVIGTEAGGYWRKIMIVDEGRQIATFRSCTTDASYPPRIRLATTSTWFMDKSMLDAGTAMMRHFRLVLRQLGVTS